MLEGAGWRWGYGMFAILVPASLAPLIVTLVWAEWTARKRGYIVDRVQKPRSILQKTKSAVQKLDLLGLILLGTSVALILLPLTLAQTAKGGWKNRECSSLHFRL